MGPDLEVVAELVVLQAGVAAAGRRGAVVAARAAAGLVRAAPPQPHLAPAAVPARVAQHLRHLHSPNNRSYQIIKKLLLAKYSFTFYS